jgi:acyl-homoserine lactone acylase PvdQ
MRNRVRALIFGITLVLVMSLGSPTVASRVRVIGTDDGSITIVRDEYGVAHVFGKTLAAVWFGVGYAQAQDRLWQAELLRRSATGTSAEILGPSALESDKLSRIVFGSAARRAALFEAAAPETKISTVRPDGNPPVNVARKAANFGRGRKPRGEASPIKEPTCSRLG